MSQQNFDEWFRQFEPRQGSYPVPEVQKLKEINVQVKAIGAAMDSPEVTPTVQSDLEKARTDFLHERATRTSFFLTQNPAIVQELQIADTEVEATRTQDASAVQVIDGAQQVKGAATQGLIAVRAGMFGSCRTVLGKVEDWLATVAPKGDGTPPDDRHGLVRSAFSNARTLRDKIAAEGLTMPAPADVTRMHEHIARLDQVPEHLLLKDQFMKDENLPMKVLQKKGGRGAGGKGKAAAKTTGTPATGRTRGTGKTKAKGTKKGGKKA